MTVNDKLSDANLVQSYREYARWQLPSATLEREGVFVFAGASRFPVSCINGAVRTDPNVDAEKAIALATEFFRAHNRGFTFVTRANADADFEQRLNEASFICDSDIPCLWIDKPVFVRPYPAGVRIEALTELRHVADIVTVTIAAYAETEFPEKQVRAMFSHPEGLLSTSVGGVIAYQDEAPVAAAITILSPTSMGLSAGIYWVGTVPTARGKGLAEICAAMTTNIGFERGAKVVTLQASKLGDPIYRRMGYREYDRQRWYRYSPTRATSPKS
jgi:ribosomal protein S18 acetylase RimI-like enzyme